MAYESFKKAEKLCKKKIIQELFKKGSYFYLYPFKVIFQENTDPTPTHNQVLFSVPKRSFKKAVHRNKIKRRLREAYRKNKYMLEDEQKYYIAYIYTGKEILSFQEIEIKLKTVLKRFKEYRQN